MRKVGLLVLATVLTLAADKFASPPVPPTAKKVPNVTEVNGQKLVDDYYWLRDKANPEVKAYLEAENAYTDSVMKPTEAFQKALYDEMLGRIKETDVKVPYKEGGYFYYSRTEAGKQYPIRCRRKGSMDAAEEVLLDVNELAKGQIFMSLGELGERRRKSAGIQDRQHGLPPVHACGERSAHRKNAARSCRERRFGGLGERQQDILLHDRRRGTKRQYRLYSAHGGNYGRG